MFDNKVIARIKCSFELPQEKRPASPQGIPPVLMFSSPTQLPSQFAERFTKLRLMWSK
jgi:hypothetical protein